LASGKFAWRVSRAALLHRAGSAALGRVSDDERRKVGLKIIKELTREREPWYLAALPCCKSDDGQL
jgi:hypothetical protein